MTEHLIALDLLLWFTIVILSSVVTIQFYYLLSVKCCPTIALSTMHFSMHDAYRLEWGTTNAPKVKVCKR